MLLQECFLKTDVVIFKCCSVVNGESTSSTDFSFADDSDQEENVLNGSTGRATLYRYTLMISSGELSSCCVSLVNM